jgi:hypothetical protein
LVLFAANLGEPFPEKQRGILARLRNRERPHVEEHVGGRDWGRIGGRLLHPYGIFGLAEKTLAAKLASGRLWAPSTLFMFVGITDPVCYGEHKHSEGEGKQDTDNPTELSVVDAPINVHEPFQHIHRGNRDYRAEELLLQV